MIHSQTAKDNYSENNSIKFEPETIKSNLCDYSDAYILVTSEITEMQEVIQILHLKIVHHFQHVNQSSMKFLLTKSIISISQCLCTI